ncbi:hypothetical protein DICPUDRAFT_99342 [Dictyostelium purpureum]|uniref:Protein kinase domain-containing protein n=1 Tax=Dictyostelium purpureum TaxID=5786 RepID=F0ZYC1_DICPU|nr:uncharacterized protein DICPUDRAFT_99342 [Dictyostelium purpureum]EGC31052.1 hypothetical protein DICPUDRAFT_99342 [Dictyostelium purpureum]|eukprot:XP_003292411.1 hypothetical protein DICPUDRAFT_99342 [Dictyostelium purpureum]
MDNFEQLLKNYTKGEYVTKKNDRGITFYYSKNNPEFFIKELTNELESNRENIIQLLDHPNIVKFEDNKEIFSSDSKPLFYIVTKFVQDSCTIKEKLEKTSKFKRKAIIKIINQFIDILEYLKESDVLHCDICSDNVMIDSDNNITLIDFGVSMEYFKPNEKKTTRSIILSRKGVEKELNAYIDIKDLGLLLLEFKDKIPNNISAEKFNDFIKCCKNGTNLNNLRNHNLFHDISNEYSFSVNTTESPQISGQSSTTVSTPVSALVSIPVSDPVSVPVSTETPPQQTNPTTQLPPHCIEISPNFYHNNNVSGEYSHFTGTDGFIDLIGQSINLDRNGVASIIGGSMEQQCPCCGHKNLRSITEGLFKRALACECKNRTNGFCLCERRSYRDSFFNNDYSQCNKHHGIYTQQTANGTSTYLKYRQHWTVTNEKQETTILQKEPRIVLKK